MNDADRRAIVLIHFYEVRHKKSWARMPGEASASEELPCTAGRLLSGLRPPGSRGRRSRPGGWCKNSPLGAGQASQAQDTVGAVNGALTALR
jgi:hypothetical protein